MKKPEFFVTPGYGEYMLSRFHYSQAVKIGDRVNRGESQMLENNKAILEAANAAIAI